MSPEEAAAEAAEAARFSRVERKRKAAEKNPSSTR
jgi:hypothetical protein